jgi:hypothetical protein
MGICKKWKSPFICPIPHTSKKNNMKIDWPYIRGAEKWMEKTNNISPFGQEIAPTDQQREWSGRAL